MPAREVGISSQSYSSFDSSNLPLVYDPTDWQKPRRNKDYSSLTNNEPNRVLSSLNPGSPAMNGSPSAPRHSTPNGTIRAVPAERNHLETEESRRGLSKAEAMPHATLRQAYVQSTPNNPSLPPLSRQNNIVRQISSEFGGIRSYTTGNLQQAAEAATSPNPGNDGQWSAAVGRANIGKSGRVIEKLMGEVDSLKRQRNFEKTRAEEADKAYNLIKSLYDGQSSSLSSSEQRLTNMESSLRLQERVNGQLKLNIVTERAHAERYKDDANKWAGEAQVIQKEFQEASEILRTRAELAETRSNILEGHWEQEGALLNKTVVKVRGEIKDIVALRQEDDKKIQLLCQVMEQRDQEYERVLKENEAIRTAFEQYKLEQEEALRELKNKLLRRERELEKNVEESKIALDKLKWALNVKNSVKDAR